MKKLLTPRGYLSWTQIDMWLRSKDRYIKNYFHGDEMRPNDAMEFGKVASEALETGEDTGDALMDMLVSLLPAYKYREHEIRATFKAPAGEVELLGKLDTFQKTPLAFREYKTGMQPWTKARARSHKQILHYSALIYLFHGKLPKEVWLDWAETERNASDRSIQLTGKIESFEVTPTLGDVLEYLSLAGSVAKEIDARYREEIESVS